MPAVSAAVGARDQPNAARAGGGRRRVQLAEAAARRRWGGWSGDVGGERERERGAVAVVPKHLPRAVGVDARRRGRERCGEEAVLPEVRDEGWALQLVRVAVLLRRVGHAVVLRAVREGGRHAVRYLAS